VFLDASPLTVAQGDLWQANALRFGVLALVLSLVTVFIVRVSVTQPLTQIARWTRTLKTGKPAPPPAVPDARLFGSLALEVSGLATSLHRARVAAAREAALRLRGESDWTEERLKQYVSQLLGDRPLIRVLVVNVGDSAEPSLEPVEKLIEMTKAGPGENRVMAVAVSGKSLDPLTGAKSTTWQSYSPTLSRPTYSYA